MKEYRYSQITERNPDKDRYPLFYQASAQEYVLEAGEMLFIPAGWFHAVYSEDADTDTGLNFAISYWFHPENNWVEGQPSCLLPRKMKNNLPPINPQTLCSDRKLRVFRSELNGLFPSEHMFHKFNKKCHVEHMTFDEFYITKNKKYYVLENEVKPPFIPEYTKPIYMSASLVNFGNPRSLIHYDGFDNLLCQFQGKNRVILFPHEDRDLLYMFNPTPISTIIRIRKFQQLPLNYIEKTRFDSNEKLATIYKNLYIDYSRKNGCDFMFEFPTSFREVSFSGVYDKIQNYPVTAFFITEGTGMFTFNGRGTVNVVKGDALLFPTHFTHLYELSGSNLKIMVPI